MQVIEVTIMILVAIVAGSLTLHLVMTTDPSSLKIPLQKEDTVKFSYAIDEFPQGLATLWDDCMQGEKNSSYGVALIGSGTVTRNQILEYLEKYNMNQQLPPERVIFKRVFAPSLLDVKCKNGLLYVGKDYSIILHSQDNRYIDCWIDDNDYLQCHTPNGMSGVTHIILRVYEDFTLIDEITITVYVTDRTVFDATEATYIAEDTPSQNHASENYVYSGRLNGKARRVLLRFPSVQGIDPSHIASARILLTQAPSSLPAVQNITVSLTTTPWHAMNATWGYPWIAPGGDYLSTPAGWVLITNTTGEVTIDITPLVRMWIQSPNLDRAVILKDQAETVDNSRQFYAMSMAEKPRLAIYTTP